MRSFRFIFIAAVAANTAWGWLSPSQRPVVRTQALQMNIFSDIGDMMTGGKLVPQTAPLQHEPLGSVCEEEQVFAIQERAISFTGEDFDVYDVTNDRPFSKVKGAMLHLPGKDKMNIFSSNNQKQAELDRKLVAMTPTYDIYRSNGEKLGWIEKEVVALTDTFDVYLEGQGGVGPFKPPPAYRLSGDFIDRRFVMRNSKNEVVAKVSKDWLIEFDAFNHYQVQVAEGFDPTLVIACACAIDEEFDEEHKARKEKASGD